MSEQSYIQDNDFDYIWDKIQEKQLIYHQLLAPNGQFNRKEFYKKMDGVPAIVMLDRNIFTMILELCENGSLRDKNRTADVGLIMIWAIMHDMYITPGYSVQEYATQRQDEHAASIEIQKFFEILKAYSPLEWLALAQERKDYIAPCLFSGNEASTLTKNAEGTIHYYMSYAAMIHLVRLYKNTKMTNLEKMLDFFNWTYDNIQTSAAIIVYVLLVIKKRNGIAPPHHVGNNSIEKVLSGCENQAWDLTYLANWFKITWTESYTKTVFFASADKLFRVLLPEILAFYATANDWYKNLLSKNEYTTLTDLLEKRNANRIMPDITTEGMKELIKDETEKLKLEMNA